MNIDITGKTIKILEENEILQKKDICRLIVMTGMDSGFDTTFKPENYNPLAWQKCKKEMSGWIGRPIKDFSYHVWYEYARIIEN